MSNIRYEIKFDLNDVQFSRLLNLVKNERFLKSYPQRKVNSLYFDTYDFQSVKENISGDPFRKKIRLRWYDSNHNSLNLEIKKRIGRLGDKQKIKINLDKKKNIKAMNSKEIIELVNNIEIKPIFFNPQLKPILYVNYMREYFESSDGLRLTIDKKIQFSPTSFLNSLDSMKKIKYNKKIVEIKFPTNMKQNLNNILKKYDLLPSRHSKYLTGVSRLGYASYL